MNRANSRLGCNSAEIVPLTAEECNVITTGLVRAGKVPLFRRFLHFASFRQFIVVRGFSFVLNGEVKFCKFFFFIVSLYTLADSKTCKVLHVLPTISRRNYQNFVFTQ